MTSNQIEYAKYKESQRANLEKERQGRDTIEESRRSNLAKESLQADSNFITSSHYSNLDSENARHNQAVEEENHRTNLENEAIRRASNAVNYTVGMKDVGLISAQTATQDSQRRLNDAKIFSETANTNLLNATTAFRKAETEKTKTDRRLSEAKIDESRASARKLESEVGAQMIGNIGRLGGAISQGIRLIKGGN